MRLSLRGDRETVTVNIGKRSRVLLMVKGARSRSGDTHLWKPTWSREATSPASLLLGGLPIECC